MMAAIDRDERRTSRALLWSISLLVIMLILWASLFELDEIVAAQGRVIPSNREQLIQSLDAGILSEILVREGQLVEKNQPLIVLDASRSEPIYIEAKEKWFSLAGQAARLRAEAYDLPIEFPNYLLASTTILEREAHAYLARKKALDDQINAMTQSLDTLNQEIKLIRPLVKQAIISEVDFLKVVRQHADLRGQIAERRNRYLTDANNELIKIETELAQAREITRAREDSYNRSTLSSPLRGIVKNVLVNTVGGVIQAGQTVMEVVPIDEKPIIEAYVKPIDIAFISVGLNAKVKVTAYDFNKYGGLNGVLEHISPSTLFDDSKQRRPGGSPIELEESYYRVLVRVIDADIARKGKTLTLIPGMIVTVDVLTGKKTVTDYVLGPLGSVSQAFRER